MRGAIFTVGGSPEPIIKALTWHPAEFVLFVVSDRSEAQVTEKILPALSYTPQYEILRVTSADDLASCYTDCRHGIREWLERRRLDPAEVYFDHTGGTKPMSAAMTLAAAEWIPRYHYVSGERDKGELGVVITGTERPVEGWNPWLQLALKQRELATRFYRQGYVEQAADLLEEAAKTATTGRQTLTAYAALCRLLARLDRLDFQGLGHELGRWQAQLEVAFEQAGNRKALEWIRQLREHWRELQREAGAEQQHPQCLKELLACARRRARQGRYDDAIARLYRAVELYAQDRLNRAFGARLGIVELEKLDPALAEQLRSKFPQALDEKGRLKLGLMNACLALRFSPHQEDHQMPEVYEQLKPALEKRNQSWLAHGARPADKADFDEMWRKVLEAVGLEESAIPDWPDLSFEA